MLLVVDAAVGIGDPEKTLALKCAEQKIPFILAFNKSDLREVAEDLLESARRALGSSAAFSSRP